MYNERDSLNPKHENPRRIDMPLKSINQNLRERD